MSGGADYILPLAVVGGLAFVAYKFFGGGAGGALPATAQANQTAATNTQAVASAAVQANPAGRLATDPQLNSAADTIYHAGGGGDLITMAHAISQGSGSNADFYRMYQLFGTRPGNTGHLISFCGLLSFNCAALDLGDFVNASIGDDDYTRNQINEMLSANGVNYQF
jgi:hypothetical protein